MTWRNGISVSIFEDYYIIYVYSDISYEKLITDYTIRFDKETSLKKESSGIFSLMLSRKELFGEHSQFTLADLKSTEEYSHPSSQRDIFLKYVSLLSIKITSLPSSV